MRVTGPWPYASCESTVAVRPMRPGVDDQGFGVPTKLLQGKLAEAGAQPVSTGPCVG